MRPCLDLDARRGGVLFVASNRERISLIQQAYCQVSLCTQFFVAKEDISFLLFQVLAENSPLLFYFELQILLVRTVQEIVFNEAALKVFTRNCCKVFQEMQNIGLPNLSITTSNKKKNLQSNFVEKMALTVF